MARFVAGQPVVTAVPSVVVDAGLPVGQHRFRLEVLTDTGPVAYDRIACGSAKRRVDAAQNGVAIHKIARSSSKPSAQESGVPDHGIACSSSKPSAQENGVPVHGIA